MKVWLENLITPSTFIAGKYCSGLVSFWDTGFLLPCDLSEVLPSRAWNTSLLTVYRVGTIDHLTFCLIAVTTADIS